MLFEELQIREQILKAINEKGFKSATEIQAQCIPLIREKKDVIGQSMTGSGKTAAFGIPMLETVIPGNGIQGLILTPTRELCVQVRDALSVFAKYMSLRIINVYGGVGIGQQLQAAKSADIIVATPGRLLDVLKRGVSISTVKLLVLDEADRMLDMGFIDDVERILRFTPQTRQTLLFSATIAPKLQGLVKRYMRNPVSVKVKLHVDKSFLTEKYYDLTREEKFSFLVHLLKHETAGIALVFCGTRRMVDIVARNLRAQQIDATPIHGGLSQSHRMHAINTLHKRGIGVLVATDVASRGLHIDNISHVYNYDPPQTSDDYVHRIGRTARAGTKGEAISFITKNEYGQLNIIMRDTGHQILRVQKPEFERVGLLLAEKHKREEGGHGHGGGRHGQGHRQGGKRRFFRRRR